MNDFSPEAIAARIEATNRQFFPENYPDLMNDEKPQGYRSIPTWQAYADIIGMCMKLYRDKSNSPSDRIAALDLHRKTLRDAVELAIFDGVDLNEA